MIRNALYLALSVVLAGPATVAAETAIDSDASTDAVELEPMVIAATRTERPRFTTPASISTLSRDDIETIQPFGYQDLFESIPGVSIQGGPRRIAEEPSIRGFADEQVVLRLDGTRQNFNKAHGGRFLLDPDLIRSVEVLRGASSSVYGSGALGGVFLIETVNGRDLTGGADGLGVRLRASYQDNGDELSGFGTFYGQAGAFDVLGSYLQRDVGEDLQDGAGQDILASRDEVDQGLLKFGFEPGPNQRLELAVERFRNQGRNPTNANEVATATNLVDRDTERDGLRLRYRVNPSTLPWLNLETALYQNEVETFERRFLDGRIDISEFETRGLELTNSSELGRRDGSPIRLTWGIETYTDEQSGRRNGLARPQFPDAEIEYRAAFIQAELPLGGGLSVIPGMRFDSFDYGRSENFDSRDDDEISGRVALGWEAGESLYFWAEYAEAFRAPSLTELYADGVHFVVPLAPGQVVINEFVPTPDLAPERAEQFQLGGRFRQRGLFGSGMDFELDAVWHRSEVDNYVEQFVVFISGPPSFDPITRNLVFPGITTNSNIDARLSGFEVDARLSSARGYFEASVATLDSRRDGGGGLASVQPDRLRLGAGVHLADRQWTLGAEFTAAADRSDVPEGGIQTPGYGKTDLFLNYLPVQGPLAGFEFRLALDNLFDKDFSIHPNAIAQPGRSVRLSLARNFEWLN